MGRAWILLVLAAFAPPALADRKCRLWFRISDSLPLIESHRSSFSFCDGVSPSLTASRADGAPLEKSTTHPQAAALAERVRSALTGLESKKMPAECEHVITVRSDLLPAGTEITSCASPLEPEIRFLNEMARRWTLEKK